MTGFRLSLAAWCAAVVSGAVLGPARGWGEAPVAPPAALSASAHAGGRTLQVFGLGLAFVGSGLSGPEDGARAGFLAAGALSVLLGTVLFGGSPAEAPAAVLPVPPPAAPTAVATLAPPIASTQAAAPPPAVSLVPSRAPWPRWPERLQGAAVTARMSAVEDVRLVFPIAPVLRKEGEAWALSMLGRQCLAGLAEWWKTDQLSAVRVIAHAKPSGDPAADRVRTRQQAEALSAFLFQSGRADPTSVRVMGMGSIESAEDGAQDRVEIQLTWIHLPDADRGGVDALIRAAEGRWEGRLERVVTELAWEEEEAAAAPRRQAAVADALREAAAEGGWLLMKVLADRGAGPALEKSGLDADRVEWRAEEATSVLHIRVEQLPLAEGP